MTCPERQCEFPGGRDPSWFVASPDTEALAGHPVEGLRGNLVRFLSGPQWRSQHEIELGVAAGVPSEVALQAATANAAKLLRADSRIGTVEKGKEATLLIVDGNPLQDVRALSAVSIVLMKGERVIRSELFKQD